MRHQDKNAANPITTALGTWLHTLSSDSSLPLPPTLLEELLATAPKRWVVYEPMALLPTGSFSSPSWLSFLSSIPPHTADLLWSGILSEISSTTKGRLTHLAVNEGIPLLKATGGDRTDEKQEGKQEGEQNMLRSPTGLRVLYGDFGPDKISGQNPTSEEFNHAFWPSTKQNGIYQTWAPRWTMFSRGNVTEKARLLNFHSGQTSLASIAASKITSKKNMANSPATITDLSYRRRTRGEIERKWAVDLYAGIGYFVLSYAKAGMRILCWELNAWSVEGLRRAAERNGFRVRVVQGEEEGGITMEDVLTGGEEIVVFLEDNAHASRRLKEMRKCRQQMDDGKPEEDETREEMEVLHVNCGLLPRSDGSWGDALDMIGNGDGTGSGWLHLHENVGVADIPQRRGEIQDMFHAWCKSRGQTAVVEHVEQVKTFAPGVWHCVFDVYVQSSSNTVMVDVMVD